MHCHTCLTELLQFHIYFRNGTFQLLLQSMDLRQCSLTKYTNHSIRVKRKNESFLANSACRIERSVEKLSPNSFLSFLRFEGQFGGSRHNAHRSTISKLAA